MTSSIQRGSLAAYALNVRTPAEAAALVASGCGCESDGTHNAATFAVQTGPLGNVTWSGVVGTENELTGDGRMIESNALRWENLPASLRYAPEDLGAHGGAQKVGRIMTLERRDNGDIWGTGDIDMDSPLGPEAARLMATGYGVSMDLDSVSFEIRVAKELMESMGFVEGEDLPTDDDGRVTVMEISADDEVMVTTDGRIRGATLVDIPAFIRASLALDDPSVLAVGDEVDAKPEDAAPTPPDCSCDEDDDNYDPDCRCPEEDAEDAEADDDALVAGGYPMEPPAEWFQDPGLTGPTPLTITPDGRVYGHLAVWGTCHTAYSGQCVEPPHSPSGYAYFRTGAVVTKEHTEVPVGRITLDTMHAGRNLGAADTLAHYEHTGKATADVAAGEDAFGIWLAGSLRPGLPKDKVRALRASPISGDWRRIGGSLELVAALAVNSPGFPVPRPQGLVASGAMQSLVASGVLMPDATDEEMGLSPEDLKALKALAARERKHQKTDRKTRADALAAKTRTMRAAALARAAGVR